MMKSMRSARTAVVAFLLSYLSACSLAYAQTPATCVVSGRVLDLSLAPVVGAEVRLRVIPPQATGGITMGVQDVTTTTNSNGDWTLTAVAGAKARINIPASTISNDTVVPTSCPAVFPTDFTLYPPGSVTPATIISTTGPTAAGDLIGRFPSPVVAGLRGYPITSATPTDGVVPTFSLSQGKWNYSVPAGSGVTSVSAGGGVSITGTAQVPIVNVATSGVSSAMLASGAAAANVGTLSNALTGTLPSPSIASGYLTNAHVNSSAGIAWTKIDKTGSTAADVGAAASSHTHLTSNVTGLDTALAARLQLTGGTMTGTLTLSGAPLSGLQAATKQYVDDGLATKVGTLDAIPQSQVTGLVSALSGKQATSEKGQPNGYASLGSNGLVVPTQLPTSFAPTAHAPTHASAGSDPVTPAAIGASAIGHTHTTPQVTGLDAALANRGQLSTPNTWSGLQTFSGGVSIPGGFTNDGDFFLTSAHKLSVYMSEPSNVVLTPSTTGGVLPSGTYYYKVTALDQFTGQTIGSVETSTPVTGPTGSVAVTWTSVPGATYRVFRGTAPAGQNTYFASSTNSYTDTGGSGTAGSPPLATTAYAVRISPDSSSWLLGGSLLFQSGTNALTVSGPVTATSFTGPLSGNATTATALAANPTDCAAGQFASSIAANGNLGCATVSVASVNGILDIVNGGTGANNAPGAIANLAATPCARLLNATAPLQIDAASSADLCADRTLSILGATTGARGSVRLAGDIGGTADSVTVSAVGGQSAANVASGVSLANAATSTNTASTIVKRDASGNFSAGTITASVTGNVSGSAASFTGPLTGDVTGNQGATVVSLVGGQTATSIANGVVLANAATSTNTASTIVKRDASGNAAFGTITGSLSGNASTATTLSATLAIALGGTGQTTATAAFNALSPTTTKGDFIVFNGTSNARLPVCANGQAFIADSAQSSGWNCGATSGGTVTSVGLSMPATFSVSNSPINSSGTIAVTYANANANSVLAGPTSGGAAAPTMRALVSADIPNNAANTSGSAASFTGPLSGDVTGTQGATVVATVAGSTAANVHAAELLANAATDANTASAIVKRDGAFGFSSIGDVRLGRLRLGDNAAPAAELEIVKSAASTATMRLTNNTSGLRVVQTGATTEFREYNGSDVITGTPLLIGANYTQGILRDKGGAVHNVMSYGATGGGVADDTAAINAAIAGAASLGGIVYFPAGTYKVTSTITVSANNERLRGVGMGGTVISSTVLNASTFVFSGNSQSISDMTISIVGSPTSGQAGVTTNGGGALRSIEGVEFTNFRVGISVGNGVKTVIRDCEFSTGATGAQTAIDVTGPGGQDFQVSGITISANPIVNGIAVQTGYGGHIGNLRATVTATGAVISLADTSYVSVRDCVVSNASTATGSSGIAITGGGSTAIAMSNSTVFGGEYAARVTGGGDHSFVGVTFTQAGKHGFYHSATGTASLTSCQVYGNSLTTTNTYSGVYLASTSRHFGMQGGVAGSSGQKYGIEAQSGADQFYVSGVDVSGNTTAQTSGIVSTIASASTVTATANVHHVSGTTTIATINAPPYIGTLTLIPDAVFALSTSGNIAFALAATVGVPIILTRDDSAGKWYPTTGNPLAALNATSVLYANASGGPAADPKFAYVAGTLSLGVGVESPAARIHIQSDDGQSVSSIIGAAASSAFYPSLLFRKARGSYGGGEVAVGAAATIGSIDTSPFDGVSYETQRKGIEFVSTENHAAGANGTAIKLYTVPNGSATTTQRVIIDQNGRVGIGNSAPAYTLDTSGTSAATSAVTYDAANGAVLTRSSWTNLITASGTSSDSATDIPANSYIDAVACRVVTSLSGVTDWKVGDATTTDRFIAAQTGLTSGTTAVGLRHLRGAVASDAAGPTQATTAKLKITFTGTAVGGTIRCTLWYMTPSAPTS